MTNKFLLAFSVLLMIPFISGQAHADKVDAQSVTTQQSDAPDEAASDAADNADQTLNATDEGADAADDTPDPTFDAPSTEPSASTDSTAE